MKAIVVNAFGGSMDLQEIAAPTGEVIVNAAWAGINFVDTYMRAGRYPGISLPLNMGVEGAGVVHSAPKGSGWKPGDRVVYTTGVRGTYAQQVAVPAENLISVPGTLSLRNACAAIEHGLTATMLLDHVARLSARSTVLVHAAAGGVGGWLAQMLVARGHRVYGTVSSARKAAWLESHSVRALRYDDGNDWLAQFKQLNEGRGAEVVFDSVGRSTFSGSFEAATQCGHVVLYGSASGQPDPVDVLALMRKSLTLSRPVLNHYMADSERLRASAKTVFSAVLDASVELRVHREYALAEAEVAHADLVARGTEGKLLLAIAPELDVVVNKE